MTRPVALLCRLALALALSASALGCGVDPQGSGLRGSTFSVACAALNPVYPIGYQIGEVLQAHRGMLRHEAETEVIRLLGDTGIPEPEKRAKAYPFELSGGMRQRAVIAIATATQPKLLIADEPTTALDVSVQAQVLNILISLQREKGIGMLFISHDLSVVERIAGRVAVMYLGQIVEEADTERVIGSPQHPYTQALLSSVPDPDPGARRERIRLTGELPSPTEPIIGCPFASRCPEVQDICKRVAPPLEEKTGGHSVACHLR